MLFATVDTFIIITNNIIRLRVKEFFIPSEEVNLFCPNKNKSEYQAKFCGLELRLLESLKLCSKIETDYELN